jgi:16S rRNA processing protein RimM
VRAVVPEVDLEARRLVVDPPPGLLEEVPDDDDDDQPGRGGDGADAPDGR